VRSRSIICWAVLLWSGSTWCPGCGRFGCQREEPSPPPVVRGPTEARETPGSEVALPNVAKVTEEDGEKQRLMREMLAGGPETEKEKSGEVEEKRDLEAELRRLVGNPAACMKPRTEKEGPESIRVSVEAAVTENGVVTRSYATSPDLSAEELECIDRRVSGSRFRAPVEEAPRTVRSVVEIRQAGL
jgi:hypothetical protein